MADDMSSILEVKLGANGIEAGIVQDAQPSLTTALTASQPFPHLPTRFDGPLLVVEEKRLELAIPQAESVQKVTQLILGLSENRR